MTDAAPDLTTMPVLALDPAEIGERLIRALAVSATLRHTGPEMSMDYVSPEPGSAGDFVKDMLTLSTPEIAEKWCGSTEGAAFIASTVLASQM